jgi:hypothetical protein
MLISMPTGTSTILGVIQVIPSSQVWRELHAEVEPRTTPDITQVRKIERRTPAGHASQPIFLSETKRFLSWTRPSGYWSIGVQVRLAILEPSETSAVAVVIVAADQGFAV